jgi:Secretion system C-terminal sorting domain
MKNFLLVFFLGSFFVTYAQWNNNTTLNNAVCTASNATTKQNIATVSDSSGGLWIVWEDARNNSITGTDIYAQKLNANGSLAFDVAGVVICNALLNQSNITITDDGVGGCIIAWTDGRAGNNDIYAQRITSTGSIAWANNGVVVSNNSGVELLAVIERVNATEAIIGWRDDRNNTSFSTGQDYFMNKLLISNGSKQWINDYELVRANNTQSNLRLLRNAAGGVFAVWQDPRVATTNADIYLQIVNNNGTGALTNYGANLTATATFNQANAQIISDEATGAIIVWDDNRTANNDQAIYAQKVNASGVEQWTSGGVLISDIAGANNNQRNPYLTKDGSGGAIIAWQDTRNSATSNSDIYTQRISNLGIVQWDANGVLVCNATGNQPNSATSGFGIISDNANGAYIFWDDARISSSDLEVYAQRVNNTGSVLWASNGVPVANKSGSNQRAPSGVEDGSGRILLVWQDGRTTANSELFASRVENTGVLPLNFLQIFATNNGDENNIIWHTANEVNVANYTIEKSSNGIGFSTIGNVNAFNKNSNTYSFTDAFVLSGTAYYRIIGTDNDGSKTYSTTVSVTNNGAAVVASVQAFPNPVHNQLQIRLNNLSTGNYQLRIVDVYGKQIQQNTITVNTTLFNTFVNTSKLQTGTYFLQLINENGKYISAKSFIKQ